MNFGKSLIHYIIAEGLGRILPLFLMPWIAKTLSTQDFGLYSLFQLYVMIGVVIILTGTDQSLFRFIPGSKGDMEKKWLSTGMIFTALMGVLLFIIIAALSELTDFSLFGSKTSFAWYHLPLVIIMGAVNNQFYTYLKAKHKSRNYMFLFLIRLSLFYFVFITAILFAEENISFILAYYTAEIFVFLILLKSLKEKIDKPKISYLLEMLKFGLPMFLITILGIMIYQLDHYMIKIYEGVAEVGKYSFSYKYAAAAGAMILLINRVWLPRVYERGSAYLKKTLRPVMVFSSIFYMLVFLLIYIIFQSLQGTQYLPEAFHILKIFPILGMGYFFFSGLQQLDAYLLLNKQTTTLSIFYIIVFIFNFVSNIWAIPRFGIEGAATTTLLSFFVLWILLLSSFLKRDEFKKKLLPYLIDFSFLAGLGLLSVLTEKPLYPLLLLLAITPLFLKRIGIVVSYKKLFKLRIEEAVRLKE